MHLPEDRRKVDNCIVGSRIICTGQKTEGRWTIVLLAQGLYALARRQKEGGQLYCWLKDYMHWPEDRRKVDNCIVGSRIICAGQKTRNVVHIGFSF